MVPTPTDSFLLYESQDGTIKIDVHFEDETVWLTLDQMASLFSRDKSTISKHIKNIFTEDERLKKGSSYNYFKELLDCIREIRLSERLFYQQIKDIYATSIDYDPTDEATLQFYNL